MEAHVGVFAREHRDRRHQRFHLRFVHGAVADAGGAQRGLEGRRQPRGVTELHEQRLAREPLAKCYEVTAVLVRAAKSPRELGEQPVVLSRLLERLEHGAEIAVERRFERPLVRHALVQLHHEAEIGRRLPLHLFQHARMGTR
jgi:hypothetical protein